MSMNKDTVDLLNEIYQSAQTGIRAAKIMMDKTENKPLKDELISQYKDYTGISAIAEKNLTENNILPKDINPITKATMWGSVQLNTITDKTPSKICEIIINGTNMGIVEMTKNLHRFTNSDSNSQNLAKEFIKNEEYHIDRLKGMLC